MDASDLLDDVVAGLYEAAADSARWAAVWQAMAGAFGASSGTLFIDQDPATPTFLALPGWSDTATRLYASHYGAIDPYAIAARHLDTPGAVLGQHLVPQDAYEESEVWQDFARYHVGAFHFMGAALPIGHGYQAKLALHRLRDAPAFDEADRRRLDRILRHVRGALSLFLRLQVEHLGTAVRGAALDRLETGVLVADTALRPVYANGAAELLAGRVGLTFRAHLPLRVASVPLRAVLEGVARGGPGGSVVIGNGGRGLYRVSADPLPLGLLAGCGLVADAPPRLVLVLIAGGGFQLGTDELKQLFGLTAAEADIALALAGGTPVAGVAAARGTSVLTVRAQIRTILEKTGADGIRGLARTVRPPDRSGR